MTETVDSNGGILKDASKSGDGDEVVVARKVTFSELNEYYGQVSLFGEMVHIVMKEPSSDGVQIDQSFKDMERVKGLRDKMLRGTFPEKKIAYDILWEHDGEKCAGEVREVTSDELHTTTRTTTDVNEPLDGVWQSYLTTTNAQASGPSPRRFTIPERYKPNGGEDERWRLGTKRWRSGCYTHQAIDSAKFRRLFGKPRGQISHCDD